MLATGVAVQPRYAATPSGVVGADDGIHASSNGGPISITSRDPSPPPLDYVRRSGGLFRDMTIHDLDMARWLLAEEVVAVYAAGSCLVDPAIGAAGDVDTAVLVLTTASGRVCQITNSRRCSYGYDQRIEVFGSAGLLRVDNQTATRLEQAGPAGFLNQCYRHAQGTTIYGGTSEVQRIILAGHLLSAYTPVLPPLEDLAALPWIVPRRPHSIRAVVDGVFAAASLAPYVVVELDFEPVAGRRALRVAEPVLKRGAHQPSGAPGNRRHERVIAEVPEREREPFEIVV